jgi:GNAT superfamily N-acetyltransferase
MPNTTTDAVEVIHATNAASMAAARALFIAYAESLNFDLCFQGFDAELDTLPGRYAPPSGCILLARDTATGAWLGCVAMRDLGEGICEMKRMYVVPAARGRKVGRMLAEAVVAAGRAAHYRAMRLDTVAAMTTAIALYTSLGFAETAPYCENPLDGARFFELTY